MKQITAKINIDESALMSAVKDTGVQSLEEAISQELNWLHDSGLSVESWSFTSPEKEIVPAKIVEEIQRQLKTCYESKTRAQKAKDPDMADMNQWKQLYQEKMFAELSLNCYLDGAVHALEDGFCFKYDLESNLVTVTENGKPAAFITMNSYLLAAEKEQSTGKLPLSEQISAAEGNRGATEPVKGTEMEPEL